MKATKIKCKKKTNEKLLIIIIISSSKQQLTKVMELPNQEKN